MPELASTRNIPFVLFMLNNPLGSSWLIDALGQDRVLLGLPGAGGTFGRTCCSLRRNRSTTIGEPNGKQTTRLRSLAKVMRACGFPTRIENDLDAWLMSHAFFVTSACGAIYLAEGDCVRLSRSRLLLQLMADGVREGFVAVHALWRPVRPFALKVLFTWLPRPFAVHYWHRSFSRRMAELVLARHARHTSAEMKVLSTECRILLGKNDIHVPALDRLYRSIDDYAMVDEQLRVPKGK